MPSTGRVSTSGRPPSDCLHEGIEAALDVNAHLIAELGAEVPDDYYGGFVKLGDLGILPRELARSLAPSAGLRNRLVHEYESLDDAKVLASIGALLAQYPSIRAGHRILPDQGGRLARIACVAVRLRRRIPALDTITRHDQQREERMIKVVVLLRRPQSWTRERFHRWWLDEHVPYAKMLPDLRKYRVCLVTGLHDARGP